MYPKFRFGRPIALVGLAAAALLATDTVKIEPGDTLASIASEHGVTVDQLMELNNIDDANHIVSGYRLIIRTGDDGQPVYEVDEGDTLAQIAGSFKVRLGSLAALNQIDDVDKIKSGQKLALDGEAPRDANGTATYKVVKGDTMWEIARLYGVKVADLAAANGITNVDSIRSGSTLTVPAADGQTLPVEASVPTEKAEPEVSAPEVAAPATPTTTAPAAPTTTAPPAPTTTQAPAPTAGFPAGDNPPSSDAVLSPVFAKWSSAYGVDQKLVEAIAWRESHWNVNASNDGAHKGIGQIGADTEAYIEQRLIGIPMNPFDPSDGVQMMTRYLRYLQDRTSSVRETVLAYNAGLGAVQSNSLTDAHQQYADEVLAILGGR